VLHTLHGLDIGGGVSLHAFGAYYGLAASLALKKRDALNHPKNCSSYVSDITSMVGLAAARGQHAPEHALMWLLSES
jgi:ammonium transporter Rh